MGHPFDIHLIAPFNISQSQVQSSLNPEISGLIEFNTDLSASCPTADGVLSSPLPKWHSQTQTQKKSLSPLQF